MIIERVGDIVYVRSGEVDEVISQDPRQEEGEEAIHKMLFEYIFRLNDFLISSQKLIDIEIVEQRDGEDEPNQGSQSHEPREGYQDAEKQAEDLFSVEEDIEYFFFGVFCVS